MSAINLQAGVCIADKGAYGGKGKHLPPYAGIYQAGTLGMIFIEVISVSRGRDFLQVG